MLRVKINFIWVFLFGLFFSNDWVLDYKNQLFYEDDFYVYFSKKDWNGIKDSSKKSSVFFDFIKERASVYEAEMSGLDLDFDVQERLSGRFDRLLVNEYYMRDFLLSLVPKSALAFCEKNLKTEVFVNHILVETDSLASVLVDSLKKGGDFKALALSFSKDPSVEKNSGSLGWVGIGETVPAFQNVFFGLCVGCVGVSVTDFGYHVIRVDSLRPSKYVDLNKDEYNDFAFRFSTGYIDGSLKDFAARHDSLLLEEYNVFFNRPLIEVFIKNIKSETLKTKNKRRSDVDFVGLLGGLDGVVASYNGALLSGKWFANKLSGSFYTNVYFDDVNNFVGELRLVLLRDIVRVLALKKGLDTGFSFTKQFNSIRSSVLQKEFLKRLVQSVPSPSKTEIEEYYYLNEQSLFLNKKTGEPFGLDSSFGSVEAILLKEKQEAAKVDFFNSLKGESVKINKGWLYGVD